MLFLSCIDGDAFSVLLEPSIVQIQSSFTELRLSSEAGLLHVAGLVHGPLLVHSSITLLGDPVVERFRLVELFTVLGSLLVCVEVTLSRPGS